MAHQLPSNNLGAGGGDNLINGNNFQPPENYSGLRVGMGIPAAEDHNQNPQFNPYSTSDYHHNMVYL